MSSNRMKGFLKGLKYISQKFESEKEPEMQIGLPTDVKHVAHIGWDGPSVSPPSWMNDFKGEGSEAGGDNDDGGSRITHTQSARELPDLPKSSSKRSGSQSLRRDRSEREKPRSSRKSSRNSLRDSENSRSGRGSDSGSESNNPDVETSKKTRRKKSKEVRDRGLDSGDGVSVSRRSRSSKSGRESGSKSKSKSKTDSDVESVDGL